MVDGLLFRLGVRMFKFFVSVVDISAPIFVVSAMLNVGLAQSPSAIFTHLRNYSFVLKMLLANFVLAPLLMIFVLTFTSFDPAIRDGLLIYSLCAGAPFLIKLTKMAEHHIALGAAVMVLLVVSTVIYAPLVLPVVVYGVTIDPWAVAKPLFIQMLLPIPVGMLLTGFLPDIAKRVQPWVGLLGNVALYVLLAATLIGYLPSMMGIIRTGAVFVGWGFVIAAFGIGYLMGGGKDHLEDVGGLGTAQRNTGAGVIISLQNFDDRNVLTVLTLVNLLGIVTLMFIARRLRSDNRVDAWTI